MKKRHLLLILAVTICVVSGHNLLFGQAVNFGSIQGRVIDSTGAVVANANIVITQTDTGFTRTAASSENGQYVFNAIPLGPYQLKASAVGFQDFVQRVTLTVGSTPTIDIKFAIGTASENVEVTGEAATVDTTSNSVSTLIDNARILDMPLDGRNAPQLIMLAGGAANPTLPSNDLNSTKNYGNGNAAGPSQTISVAGGQENSNNYLMDGGDNNDAFSNINAPFPFPDAIQEFSVQANGLNAQYGVHAGATVNAVTKSGTNQWHGSAFDFLRNPIFNASPVIFSTPAPGTRFDTLQRNQFGGTLGAPIVKDKLFFFTGYQGTRQSSSALPVSVIVPTPAALTGDFTTMMSAACQSSGKAKTLKSYNGVPITGNKVNPKYFNAQSLGILQYVPVADNPCGKISYTYPNVWNEDQGIARVDWNISNKQNLFTRYFITNSRVPLPFDPENILPQSNATNQFAQYQTLAIGDNYTFGPSIVNSLHLTGTRLAIHRGPGAGMINPADVGINVPSPIPSGLPMSVSGYFNTGSGSSMPGYFINNLFQVADDVTWMKGKHQFGFGVNYMYMQLNYLSTFQSNGQWQFAGAFTGDNLMDYMLGFTSNYVQGNPEEENWRYTYFGLYAQDTYKVRPNLTLNVGIRWEPYFPSHDAKNRGSHFDYNNFVNGVHSTVYPNAPAGLQYCGDAGVPCSFAYNQWAQFSPRVGLIWDPFGDGNTTIRASYGMYFDSPEMYYFDRYADNSPYGSGVSFTPAANLGGNITNPYAGQPNIPQFPLPFPQPGDPNAYFPLNGVYINNYFNIHPMNVQSWNLGIQRQLPAQMQLSLNYVGSHTIHIWNAYEANPGLNQKTVATPPASQGGTGCTAGQAATTGNANCRRDLVVANPKVGQYFSNMTTLWDGATANYNAFLATLKKPFAQNFTILSNYTWSHCISDQDFTGELTNSRPNLYVSPLSNPDISALTGDRGNCGFDIRQSFNFSLVASTPKFSGKKAVFLGQWQIAPLLTYRTGIPITVTTGVDTTLVASTTNFKARPNQILPDPYAGSCPNGAQAGGTYCWFNTSAYLAPALGVYGNVGRNSLNGPNSFTWDSSISKQFALTEKWNFLFRMEIFNLLNHPVYGSPVTAMNNSNFGRIQTQVGTSRTFQFAAKLFF